jgi:hypothetical protein
VGRVQSPCPVASSEHLPTTGCAQARRTPDPSISRPGIPGSPFSFQKPERTIAPRTSPGRSLNVLGLVETASWKLGWCVSDVGFPGLDAPQLFLITRFRRCGCRESGVMVSSGTEPTFERSVWAERLTHRCGVVWHMKYIVGDAVLFPIPEHAFFSLSAGQSTTAWRSMNTQHRRADTPQARKKNIFLYSHTSLSCPQGPQPNAPHM